MFFLVFMFIKVDNGRMHDVKKGLRGQTLEMAIIGRDKEEWRDQCGVGLAKINAQRGDHRRRPAS
jgi:hypothetical protein